MACCTVIKLPFPSFETTIILSLVLKEKRHTNMIENIENVLKFLIKEEVFIK
jgi:hypothetical protein